MRSDIFWFSNLGAKIGMLSHLFHHNPERFVKNEVPWLVHIDACYSHHYGLTLHFSSRLINLQLQGFLHHCQSNVFQLLIVEFQPQHLVVVPGAVKFNNRHLEFIFFLHCHSLSLKATSLMNNFVNCFVLSCFQEINDLFTSFIRNAKHKVILVLACIDYDLTLLFLPLCVE